MTSFTDRLLLPYPDPADPADVSSDIFDLAQAIEDLPGFDVAKSIFANYAAADQGTEKGLASSGTNFTEALNATTLYFLDLDPDRYGDAPTIRLSGAAFIGAFTTARVPTLQLKRVASFSAGAPTLDAATCAVALPSVAAVDTVYRATGDAVPLTVAGLYALTISTPGAIHAANGLKVSAAVEIRQ